MSVSLTREAGMQTTAESRSIAALLTPDWLSFPLFAACVFACFVFFLVPPSMADPDIWWHLRNAEWQLVHHAFLRQDLYSYTAQSVPWMNHEWLAELPFYLGWKTFGARGVYLVMLAAIEAILLGVFFLCYRYSRSVPVTLVASAAAAMLATVSFGPRTLLFGWICLVAEIVVLERSHAGQASLWALPPLFALWVNLHGSWIIGLVLLMAFIACQYAEPFASGIKRTLAWKHQRELLLPALVSICALLLNPYGWRLVVYPFNLAFSQKLNIANVEEWRTLDFHSLRGRILLASLAVLFLAQVWKRQEWRLHHLAFLAIGVYASFTYSRFLFLAAILVMPVVAKSLGRASAKGKEGNRPWINLLALAALVPFLLHRFPSANSIRHQEEASFPRAALSALSVFHPEGRVFNEFLWGGYLEWNARQIPVFVDSRVDIFEYNGTFKDYLDIIRLNDSLALLDRYRIRYVLFERNAPLVYLLKQTDGWKVNYEDETTVLLERSRPPALD